MGGHTLRETFEPDARMTLVPQRLDKIKPEVQRVANAPLHAEDADRDRMAARREADLLADRIDRLEKLLK